MMWSKLTPDDLQVISESTGFPVDSIEHLLESEGMRLDVYLDSLGKPTVGIGSLAYDLQVGDVLSRRQVINRFIDDLLEIKKDVDNQIEQTDAYKALVSLHLNLNFQLGGGWQRKFPSAAKELKRSCYQESFNEFKYSNPYKNRTESGYSPFMKQTPKRVENIRLWLEKISGGNIWQ